MTAENRSVGIVGASGFLGGVLARQASRLGWRVVGFSRSPREPGDGIAEWREWTDHPRLDGLGAVVNLAGEPVDQRWTESAKRRFRESRVGVTEILSRAIETTPVRVLVNGSAVGIYGDRGDEILDDGAPPGTGYLADLCRDWEAAADGVSSATRVVKLRTGVVLGQGGAAWSKMRRVFGLGLGGRFGDGCQWMPWIHVDDLAGAIVYLLETPVSGPVNGAAPEPERNSNFTRKLAAALHRPAFLHAPEWGLKLGLGGFAEALVASQRAVPGKLLNSGYRFRYPTLDLALAELVG